MNLLHIAAMPFPTPQGTQACIAAMCRACARAGFETHLLTYGQGRIDARSSSQTDGVYTVYGLPRRPGGVRPSDQRSGPSFRKVLTDLRLVGAIRTLVREIRPDQIIAHHVEAALSCQLARVPYNWVAHTDLGAELPGYFERGERSFARAGTVVDRLCTRGAKTVAAVSPRLASQLSSGAHVLPTPWPLSDDAVAQITPEPEVIYAGNLDAYQGWEDIVDALGLLAASGLRPQSTLLTASDPSPWIERADKRGVLNELRIVRNASENERLFAMRRARIGIVPRRTPGGQPIKLLDHWSCGHAVIAQERALAGFEAQNAVLCVGNDDPNAMAEAIRCLLEDPQRRCSLADVGRAYLSQHHSDAAFMDALRKWLPQLSC